MNQERVDDISGMVLFCCSFFIFLALIMIARLLGNLMIAGITTSSDWVLGITGVVILFLAFKIPMQRVKNSIEAYPEQKRTIINRFVIISFFVFSLVGGLNMWAWNTDHTGTTAYRGPSSYTKNAQSRAMHQKEIRRRTTKATSKDVIVLRFIITTLTFGSSLLYFALLIQPYEKENKQRNRTKPDPRQRIRQK